MAALNTIDGDLVGVWISTNTVTPDYAEVVCAENTKVDGSADLKKKSTKCGVAKKTGPVDWTITGSGVHDSAPGTGKISADAMIALLQSGDEFLVKVAHTTAALVYRQGTAVLSKYSEDFSVGGFGEFDFTIDVIGDLDVVA
jgi:hypothetical protein